MSVTREEVRAFIRAHRVQLSEDLLEAAGTPGAGDLRREIEMYTLLLAALDDAERYAYIRDMKCNSMALTLNDEHAPNYITAAEEIDSNPSWFCRDSEEELARMKEANTIWTLQIYPDNPITSFVQHAATLDTLIDTARAGGDG